LVKSELPLLPFCESKEDCRISSFNLSTYYLVLIHAYLCLLPHRYVDFLDTSGTLLGIVSNMGYVDEKGDFPKSKMAYSCDALATLFGSFFGLSPVTSYIESAAGVGAGARTGMTAVFCGFFFFLSIFFAPIIASIPAWATGGSLIVVGSMMAKSLKDIKWHDPTHAATAFLTVLVMPLTYSIAYGLIAGIGTWIILQGTFHILSLCGIAKPVYELEGEEDAAPEEPKQVAEEPEDKGAKESSEEESPVVEEA
jgi:xanthine/uracil/vitamin C permease (AzgA family)